MVKIHTWSMKKIYIFTKDHLRKVDTGLILECCFKMTSNSKGLIGVSYSHLQSHYILIFNINVLLHIWYLLLFKQRLTLMWWQSLNIEMLYVSKAPPKQIDAESSFRLGVWEALQFSSPKKQPSLLFSR